MSISSHDLATLRPARETSGPTLVHRVAEVVIEGNDHGGVASQPAYRVGADQPVTLQLARQL